MVFYNIVKVYTLTTGTGTITLGSAVPGFVSFSAAGVVNGSTVSYAIEDGNSREVGTGVYNSGTSTLTRSVINSTNANNLIPLSGSATVFITALAGDLNSDQAATGSTLLQRDSAGAAIASGYVGDYVNLGGGGSVTPDASHTYSEISLSGAPTTINAPSYNGSGTLKKGAIFSLKLHHAQNNTTVVWDSAYKGVSLFPPSGVQNQYNVYTFICRSPSVVELMGVPLIGVPNT